MRCRVARVVPRIALRCGALPDLRFNRDPCNQMIDYLTRFFDPEKGGADPATSLAIAEGKDGARLTHSHRAQVPHSERSVALRSYPLLPAPAPAVGLSLCPPARGLPAVLLPSRASPRLA